MCGACANLTKGEASSSNTQCDEVAEARVQPRHIFFCTTELGSSSKSEHMAMRPATKRTAGPYKKFRAGQRPAYPAKVVTKRRILSIPTELKFNDVAFATDATTTGTVVALNTFAAGDTALLRDGNKVAQRSLFLRVSYSLEALTAAARIRFLVVLDKQANGVAPSIATALTGPLDAITMESQRRIDSMSRFMMLCDEVVTLNQPSGTGGALAKGYWEKYITLPTTAQIASFLDNTAAIPVTNGLSLMYFSDIAAGAADVDVSGTCRLRFQG